MSKLCGKCGETLPVEDFYSNKKSSDGLNCHCISCTKEATKAWYEDNRGTVSAKSRNAYLKRKYGISEDQYLELFDKQNGCCAICKRPQSEFNHRLAVDHNHKTNEIRGLLCTNCNHRIIGRHTDGSLLRKMAEYVEGGTSWFVPEKVKKKRKKR